MMENYCGSTFWNSSVTWYTDNPDFTVCFEKTVLLWIPCIFLWIFSFLEGFYMSHSVNRNVPRNWLNISKDLVTLLLCLNMLIDFIYNIYNRNSEFVETVDICSPFIKLICFIYVGTLAYYNRQYGIRTSGLLFLFWLLLGLFGAPQFRTEIRSAQMGTLISHYNNYSYLIHYPLVVLMFLLNCLAEEPPTITKHKITQNPCPEEGASFLSRLFFAWYDKLAWKGFRNPLEKKDLWDLQPVDSSAEILSDFEHYWNKTIKKYNKHKAQFSGTEQQVSFSADKKKEASVLPALLCCFGPSFIFGALLKLVQDLLTFISPQILGLIISFVKDRVGQYYWHGVFYAVLLFATASLQTLFLAQYFNRMFIIGMRIRTALISTIYKKSLNISNKARKDRTAGEIVNLMAVDAQKFIDLTAYLNMIWSAPLQIGLSMYFLWKELGPSVLAGLAVMIILIPVNIFVANKSKILQIKQMKNKDERVKLMNELLSGIKVLKLYAWEPSFEQQVLKIRDKEIKVLKKAAYLNAGTSFIWSCAPFLVALATFASFILSDKENILTAEITFKSLSLFSIMSMPMGLLPLLVVYSIEVALVSFATYVLVDEKNVLDASKAFVSISLFNILRFPLSMLPNLITNMVQALVSVKRINAFLSADELDPNNVAHEKNEDTPVIIENGNFSWDEESVLKNINIKIQHKTLTAIVGPVGSGKSSLISAFIGEMEKSSGKVNTYGKVAYVAQQAWIQNATLKDNILFGKSYDKDLYDRVVEACALKPDFDILPGGDETEIGEKGINLSGGQKQRVSLARAVYANAEIYYLDDPLSAVDAHVGKHIFDKVIGPNGLLKNKTRVLVTHGITFLPQTDMIIVLDHGEIGESGNYTELMNNRGAFAIFLLQHIQEDEEDEEVQHLNRNSTTEIDGELEKIKSQITNVLPQEVVKEIVRMRSRVSESKSNSDSNPALNGSLQRQKSQDSNKSARKESTKGPVLGEKLIEVEKSETGQVSWQVYKHYLLSIGLVIVLITILLNMLFQASSIGSNVWLGIWVNDTSVNGDNGSSVDTGKRNLYLEIYGVFGIAQVAVIFLAVLSLCIGTLNAAKKLHLNLLSNILRSSCPDFFDVTPLGRILNRFSMDIDTLDIAFPMTLRAWINCFFSVIGTIVVTSYTTPPFLIVAIPLGLVYYFIQRFYVATSRQLKRLESVSRSPIFSHFGETISGVQAIRAFGQKGQFIKESEKRVDENQICYYPSLISNRWLAVRLEMIANSIILFAALFAVLSADSKTASLVGLSITYCLQITQTLNWLVRMTSDVETNIVAVERIKEYTEVPREAPWELPNTIIPSSWPETGSVEFKDYSVRYRPGLDLVLHRVNFTVKGGEKVGIVGRTGAGKSSLTLALFRIIEAAEGEIIIDGVNIANLGLHTLRSRLTIIPQDAVLFSGSLRMNLDPFDKHGDEELWNSLELAHLKEFVKGLPSGLNHEITEGGDNLSVGQRQLVCLARALLRKTKILILDEATAAVDLETDDLIQKTIRSEFKECTVLTIAHRLNTIMDSDRVIVLDKGKIVEFDSPEQLLLNRDSIFYGMCKDAGLA